MDIICSNEQEGGIVYPKLGIGLREKIKSDGEVLCVERDLRCT